MAENVLRGDTKQLRDLYLCLLGYESEAKNKMQAGDTTHLRIRFSVIKLINLSIPPL